MDVAGAGGDREGGPGTSSTMRKLEEGRQLPWRMVNYNTWIKLANKLDLPSPVSNNDWKGLAELLGFSTEDILVLDNTKERSTIALLTNYLPKKDATVNNVARALKQMNRDDALQILLDAVPDIEAQYDSSAVANEGTDSCVNTLTQGGCGCMGPSPLSFANQHGEAGCSPCHSHPHPHPHRAHPHHNAHPSGCGLASGGCCCHHVGSAHHYHHSSSTTCSPHIHPHAPHHPHTGRASPASGLRRGSNLPLQNYSVAPPTISSGHGHQETSSGYRLFGNKGGGGVGDFYGGGSSSPTSHHRGGLVRSPRQSQPTFSPPRLEREPTYTEVTQDSMVAQHGDLDSPHPADLRSFLPYTDMEVDGEDEDGHGGSRREEPALLHTAILRGQGLVSMSPPFAHGALPLDTATDAGDDNTTPSTSMEELSSSDSGSRVSGLPLNVMRQVSEECNAKQPLMPASSSPKPRYNTDTLAAWGLQPDRSNHLGGGGGTRFGQRDGVSSLKELENLSQLPSHFMPGNDFTTIVAEQQIEDVPISGARGLRVQIKRERDSTRSCQLSNHGRGGGGNSDGGGGKQKGVAGADTYPLRIKPHTGGTTVDEVRNRKPGMLMKTTSVPIDMKVEEFKKAFRHIKVFVTYANDSRNHCKQVLSLCNCLDRNGFSCCVDVSPGSQSPGQVQATRDWCTRKFKEADFILVCLSPLYLQEISGLDNGSSNHRPPSNPNNSKGEKNSLHTAHIYQLMQEESQTSRHCSRFVPLYMDGSGCGSGWGPPAWLTHHLSYQWPSQYKDLLWMLTKPEDRIRLRTTPNSTSRSLPSSQHQHRTGAGGGGGITAEAGAGGIAAGGGGGFSVLNDKGKKGGGRMCDLMVSSPLS